MGESETEIKRWTAKRKIQVILDIRKGKTAGAEISRQHDPPPGEYERSVDYGIKGMENNCRARQLDIRSQYERRSPCRHGRVMSWSLERQRKAQSLLDEDEYS